MTTSTLFSMKGLTLAIGGVFLVVACSSDPDPTPAPTEAAGSGPAATETPETAAADWRDIPLTNVSTGETFTLASLEGSVVALEPFAVWCTNCHVQQDNIQAAYDDLRAAGVEFVSIGVEPNESIGRLERYRDRSQYPWTFAQSPVELSRALADIFGPQILAVASTPLIILDEQGEIVFHDFGFHGPDALRRIFADYTA